MIEFFTFMLVVLLALVFATVGFVKTVSWIVNLISGNGEDHRRGATAQRATNERVQEFSYADDLQACQRVLSYLKANSAVQPETHRRLVEFLDRQIDSLEGGGPSSRPVEPTRSQSAPQRPQHEVLAAPNDRKSTRPVVPSQQPRTQRPDRTDLESPAAGREMPQISRPVKKPVAPEPGDRRAEPVASIASPAPAERSVAPVTEAVAPAPWDMPDPPRRAPRRSMGEMLAGFMEEKNMRWGELTSGLLIVLSAVGLVVSLRDQLSDRIPYFSSLLFLALTAAIHGAGTYTLKQWKLRNTSRGTLLIGLALIPINFLAACLLNGDPADRPGLNEPVYWLAIGVGIAAFAWLAYSASRLLYRRGFLPLAAGLTLGGAAILAINRLITPDASLLGMVLLSIPVAISFLVGATTVSDRLWAARPLFGRLATRQHTFLALAVLTAATAIALVVVRAPTPLAGAVAMLPLVGLMGIVTAWMGASTARASVAVAGGGRTERPADSQVSTNPVVGGSLLALGGIVSIVAVLASVTYPMILCVTSLVVGTALTGVLTVRRRFEWLPLSWLLWVVGGLMAFCLLAGILPGGRTVSVVAMGESLICAPVALFFMGSSFAVCLATWTLHGKIPARSRQRFMVSGFACGGGLLLVGCVGSMIASLMHPEQWWDVKTADGLLVLGALLSSGACLWAARGWELAGWRKALPHLAAAIAGVALAHLWLWDPQLVAVWPERFRAEDAGALALVPWLSVAGGWALLLAVGVGCLMWCWTGPKSPDDQFGWSSRDAIAERAMIWAAALLSLVSAAAWWLVGDASGWASGLVAVTVVGWFLVGKVLGTMGAGADATARTTVDGGAVGAIGKAGIVDWARYSSWFMVPFVAMTLVGGITAVSELGFRRGWYDHPLQSPHWMLIMLTASMWCVLVGALRIGNTAGQRTNLLTRSVRMDHVVAWVALVGIVGWLLDGVIRGACHEIFGDWNWAVTASQTGLLGPLGEFGSGWPWLVLFAAIAAMLVCCFEVPGIRKLEGLVVAWLMAWAYAALAFDPSAAAASAARWLVPLGGLGLAIGMTQRSRLAPIWARLRSDCRLPGRSLLPRPQTQGLINGLLIVSAAVVLGIAFATTAQALLKSPEALGGPLADSWFKAIPIELNFGFPLVVVVGSCLLMAISERRYTLATVGSLVFQIVVLMALYFLVASPHEKAASRWFVGIMQAVSIGMTTYGVVWYLFRHRIHPREAVANGVTDAIGPGAPSHLQWHTVINGVLITGMAATVLGKVFFNPVASMGWINAFGSWLGIAAWVAFVGLVFHVWRDDLSGRISASQQTVRSAVTGWTGVIMVAMVAALVDRIQGDEPIRWLTHALVAVGLTLVPLLQQWLSGQIAVLLGGTAVSERPSELSGTRDQWGAGIAMGVVGLLGIAFSIHGALAATGGFWLYLALILLWVINLMGIGLRLNLSPFGFAASALMTIGLWVLVSRDPQGWFVGRQPYLANLIAIGVTLLGWVWSVVSVHWRQRSSLFPDTVMVVAVLWVAVATCMEVAADGWDVNFSVLSNPLGVTLGVVAVLMSTYHSIRGPKAQLCVLGWTVLSMSISVLMMTSLLDVLNHWHHAWIALTIAAVVAGWGVAWRNLGALTRLAKTRGWAVGERLEATAGRQLPIASLLVGTLLLFAVLAGLFGVESRVERFALAAIPFLLAFSAALQSRSNADHRWGQRLTLALISIGLVSVSFAELSSREVWGGIDLWVRLLVVLGGTMFVYGALVSRWVRDQDSWVQSLREMAAVHCGLSVVCLMLLVIAEALQFVPDVGCDLSTAEAIGVAVVVVLMIIGLITIAVRPRQAPFAMSLTWRKAYVYVAQAVAAGLVAHMYLAAPWLFEFGLKAYWPFVVMAICVAGIGVSQWLQEQKLDVLAQPLFEVGTILPVLVAVLSFIDARGDTGYDPAAVMLTIGLVYLTITWLRRSVVSGAASILFGNVALWLLLNKYPAMAFFEHPQLWLIPPAASVLVGSWVVRDQLSSQQLTAIRYLAAATIYISSTSEIFIRGIGDSLWPPMLLAGLAVAGILAGMLLRIRSFLYLGSLFLLLAMLTMVSHAHQRFHHVWPWWAFGIGLGLAILVMFGLFEKRKNEMKRMASGFRKWQG